MRALHPDGAALEVGITIAEKVGATAGWVLLLPGEYLGLAL